VALDLKTGKVTSLSPGRVTLTNKWGPKPAPCGKKYSCAPLYKNYGV